MKKRLALLCMLACILGLTACGSETSDTTAICSEEEAVQVGEQTADTLALIVEQGQQANYADQEVITAGLDSWESALPEIGEYSGILETTAEVDDEEAVINVKMAGTKHNAVMEIIISADGYQSITTNVEYTFGEKMGKAGLNTLIGMGTVFIVLILISYIIELFSLIPKIQKSFEKKKNADKDIKAEAIDNTIAQIVEKEELSDDLELVAVIAAAVAASEGAASTDGYVVRSIRRRA